MQDVKTKYQNLFQEAFDTLNEDQRQAVDQLDGPVLVLAGPGTGKTQVLAVRIANILQSKDVGPHNILCLTFTEAGATAMQKRLMRFLGPLAYQIDVFTFHGFCNKVIQENLEQFGGYLDLQPLSELEEIDVYRALIDQFADDHPLRRLSGDVYFETRRMKQLFRLMKQEHLSAEKIQEKTAAYINDLPNRPEFIYSRKYTDKKTGKIYQAGDPKDKKIEEEKKKMGQLLAAAEAFAGYNKLLKKELRYDYNDMLQWVFNTLERNEQMLRDYQERYQFILVDEYQDTNGLQNALLDLLCNYWDEPNVFVVGDDDQSIYRFQGANMDNILNFFQKYQPTLVQLKHNYRSSPSILGAAKAVIEQNTSRLSNTVDAIEKHFVASGIHATSEVVPQLVQYDNVVHEYTDVFEAIKKLHESDTPYSEIAVIYRSHKQSADLLDLLQRHGVPVNIVRKTNITQIPFIRSILNLLLYISEEYRKPFSREDLLYEIMHWPYFGIAAKDVARISYHWRRQDRAHRKPWRIMLEDDALTIKLELKSTDAIRSFLELVEKWITQYPLRTPQTLLEQIVDEGDILTYLFQSKEKKQWLQALSTLFDYAKKECAKNAELQWSDLLDMLDRMQQNGIILPMNEHLKREEGVHFMTAHGSKGLEFDHVFMIGCNAHNWEKQRKISRTYRLPDTLDIGIESDLEDERRLFFVGMTRAKKALRISWSDQKVDGGAVIPSQFIEEIHAETHLQAEAISLDDDVLTEIYLAGRPDLAVAEDIVDHDLVNEVLETFSLSVTALNKYMRCPLSFYFENIVRVPSARTKYLGFGNAVHYALQQFFNAANNPNRTIPASDYLLTHFEKGMDKYASHFTLREFEDLSTFGNQIFEPYYKQYMDEWSKPKKFITEKSIQGTHADGVPITGTIDSMQVYQSGTVVFDFKTGNPQTAMSKLTGPTPKKPEGGDYWRQMVFYHILLNADKYQNWKLLFGFMDFVQPKADGTFYRRKFVIAPDETALVMDQVKKVYEGIKAHDFDGCGEKDCKWCGFVGGLG